MNFYYSHSFWTVHIVNDCIDKEITTANAKPTNPRISLSKNNRPIRDAIYTAEPIRTGLEFSLPSSLEFRIELSVSGITPKTMI